MLCCLWSNSAPASQDLTTFQQVQQVRRCPPPHVNRIPDGLDLHPDPNEELSTQKVRSALERLYASAGMGIVRILREVQRIRSWQDATRSVVALSVRALSHTGSHASLTAYRSIRTRGGATASLPRSSSLPHSSSSSRPRAPFFSSPLRIVNMTDAITKLLKRWSVHAPQVHGGRRRQRQARHGGRHRSKT